MIYKLSDIFDLQMGKTPTRSDLSYWQNGSYDWISISDLNTDRKYISDTKERITTKAVRESGIKKIPANTVIMSFKLSIGKTAITSHDMFSNEAIMAFIDRKVIRINPDYIYYLLHALDWNKRANKAVKGRTVNKKIISQTQVNIPDYQTQLRIVKIMDSTRKRVKIQKDILSKLDTLIKARFVEMFGDPVKNEKKFLTKQLSQIGKCKNGINFHKSEIGNTVNCLTVKDFENNQVINDTTKLAKIKLSNLPSNDYFLNNGDIVFVRSNGNKSLVGRSVLIFPNNNPTLFSGFCIRFRKDSKRLESVYLLWLLKNESIRMKMRGRGVNIQNLNQQIINNLSIPVPPIELQKEFASFVQQVDKSKVVNASIMKYIISIRFYLYFKENKEGAR